MNFENLYPFQKEGVEFLLTKDARLDSLPHRLLADEMSLGKTAQALCATKQVFNDCIPTALIVCPASIKKDWANNCVTWELVDSISDTFTVYGESCNIPTDKNIIVINYELLLSDHIIDQLLQRRFSVLILDECQRLRSLDSKRSRKVLGKGGIAERCYYKFNLTGTPISNRMIDMFPILKSQAPQVIEPHTSLERFGRYFCNGFMGEDGVMNYNGASHIEEMKKRLEPFMLRRTVDEVLTQLPPIVEDCVVVDIGETDFDIANTQTATLARLIGLAKLPFIVKYLLDWTVDHPYEKLLVFCYHREVIEEVERQLLGMAVKYYGGMSSIAKENALEAFKQGINILIAQRTSAGEGVDGLQDVCNNILNAEIDWSLGNTNQANARLRRIRQKHTVFVKNLVALGTLDEIKLEVLKNKQRVFDQLFPQAIPQPPQPTKDVQEMLEDVIKELVLAVKELTVAVQDQGNEESDTETVAGEAPAKRTRTRKPKPDTTADVSTTTASTPAPVAEQPVTPPQPVTAPAAVAPAAPLEAAASAPKVTIDDVRATINKVSGILEAKFGEENTRSMLKSVVASFGVEVSSNIPEAQFPEAIAKFNAIANESPVTPPQPAAALGI